MIDYKTVEEAIRKNEFIDLLEGKNGYRYEDRLCSGPTDVGMVLYCIYKAYKEIDNHIADIFIETLKKMISGTSHDLYYATEYILFQVSLEKEGEAPFSIDNDYFEKALQERININKTKLFNENSIEGLAYSDGEAILMMANKLKDFGLNIV
ncbi:MAG: NAD glycohydrolase toxin immunity factor [Bacillota bacterium]|nr:NAD glycohydrolase toxin immunity factor [Bacillota bacterium]